MKILLILVSILLTQWAFAADGYREVNATVSQLAITGGADTINSGLTCLKLNVPVDPQCSDGWIAILNHNKELTTAAIAAKLAKGNMNLIYGVVTGSRNHCPWRVFTDCSVVTFDMRE